MLEKRSPRLYVYGEDEDKITEVAQKLSKWGFIPICPLDIIAIDVERAKLCDGLYLLKDWEDSDIAYSIFCLFCDLKKIVYAEGRFEPRLSDFE